MSSWHAVAVLTLARSSRMAARRSSSVGPQLKSAMPQALLLHRSELAPVAQRILGDHLNIASSCALPYGGTQNPDQGFFNPARFHDDGSDRPDRWVYDGDC